MRELQVNSSNQNQLERINGEMKESLHQHSSHIGDLQGQMEGLVVENGNLKNDCKELAAYVSQLEA